MPRSGKTVVDVHPTHFHVPSQALTARELVNPFVVIDYPSVVHSNPYNLWLKQPGIQLHFTLLYLLKQQLLRFVEHCSDQEMGLLSHRYGAMAFYT